MANEAVSRHCIEAHNELWNAGNGHAPCSFTFVAKLELINKRILPIRFTNSTFELIITGCSVCGSSELDDLSSQIAHIITIDFPSEFAVTQ